MTQTAQGQTAQLPTGPGSSLRTGAGELYYVAERGPHHALWKHVTWRTNLDGSINAKTNGYTEIGTAMNRLADGRYVPASAEIKFTPAGAAATNTAHQVFWKGNINSFGAVTFVTPQGEQLPTHVAGLCYWDKSSGKSVWIATLQDSIGQLLPSRREVIYTNCFSGLLADILYVNSAPGVEQLVILREQPPSPTEWGLDPAQTVLVVVTEFESQPAPEVLATAAGSAPDQSIRFGMMEMTRGSAFALGSQDNRIAVTKQWTSASGRTCLLEQVPLAAAAPALESLPPYSGGATNLHSSVNQGGDHAHLALQLPLAPQTGVPDQAVLLASSEPPKAGFMVDFDLISNNLTNFVFRGDGTYFQGSTSAAHFYGTTVVEGGCVIKFTNTGGALVFHGPVQFLTDGYRPAVFTAKDSDVVGEKISGSSGTPSGWYGSPALVFDLPTGTTVDAHDLHILYSYYGLEVEYQNGNLVHDVQFVNVVTPVICYFCGISLHNLLMNNVSGYGISALGATIDAEHLTLHSVGTLWNNGYPSTLALTNSMLIAVTNLGAAFTSAFNYTNANDSGVFKSVGAGSHYLADYSTSRGTGTSAINSALAARLARQTTYAPLLHPYGLPVGTNMMLFPTAQRDTSLSAKDRGYHYWPIDHAFAYTYVTNSRVTVTPGTVITCYKDTYNGGIAIARNAQLFAQGSPTNLVRFVEAAAVMDQPDPNWTGGNMYAFLLGCWEDAPSPASINCRFTDFSMLALDGDLVNYGGGNMLPFNFQDCQFHGGYLESIFSDVKLTNCVLDRVFADFEPWEAGTCFFQNNLFFGGSFYYVSFIGGTAVIADNLFDHTSMPVGFPDYTGGFNAFVTNCDRIDPTNAHDIILSASPSYQTGPLSRFYLPSGSVLINADTNTPANQVGLYHYTVLTNIVNSAEIKETNSWLDVGAHWVALDSNGNPVDTDGGGVADFIENGAGDGNTNDAGESSWQNAADDYAYLLTPEYLRVEYRENPWGITTNYGPPRFYWIVDSSRRAQKQLAYQILVATSTNNLNSGYGDMWDTGRVFSDQTIHVPYAGSALSSNQRLWWKVTTWDPYTGLAKSSTNAFFQIGLLNSSDWNSAYWIGTTPYPNTHEYPSPMLRSPVFNLTNPITSATAYVTAKGLYELWINGTRVGHNVLSPEWTDYNTRIQYQTYDVADYLTNGTSFASNVIGAVLGEGWCYGRTDYGNYYGTPNPQFLLRLSITEATGGNVTILSDGTWWCSTNGPIRSSSIYDGETYDGARGGSSTNWSTASYHTVHFTNHVTTSAVDAAKLFSQPNDSIRIIEYRQPVAIWTNTRATDGQFVTIFDMGQNMVGWCRLSLLNTNGIYGTGSNVVVQHAEVLQLDSNNYGANGPKKTNIWRGNLAEPPFAQSAQQRDTYVLNSDTNQVFEPHFTYHGFRFVEVAAPLAVAAQLTTNSVLGCVIHSGVPITGAAVGSQTNGGFTCSNTNITRLVQNAFWGLRGNLQGVFTACTQRGEREGYLGPDEQLASQTACFFVDMAAFTTKWIRDMRDAQDTVRGDGAYPLIAPWDAFTLVSSTASDPAGQIAGIVFPWRMYQNYADTRLLAEHYASSKRWFGYLAQNCTNVDGTWKTSTWGTGPGHIWPSAMDWMEGDNWLYLGSGPSGWAIQPPSASASWETWGTAWSAHSADILAGMSMTLLREALARQDWQNATTYSNNYCYYTNIATRIREAYVRDLVTTDGAGNIVDFYSRNLNWHSTSQGDCLSALYFDMIPKEQRPALITNVLLGGYWGISNYNKYSSQGAACSNHLSTGYTWSWAAMPEFTRDGLTSKAYNLLTNAEFPSWLYMVTNGFTTCWEGWNTYIAGPGGGHGYSTKQLTCSFNHLPFGTVAEWIWRVVGGINPDDGNPGFANVLIKPEPGGGITNTCASFRSIHGSIVSSWTNDTSAHVLNLNVTVPANATASVFIPSTNDITEITEGGRASTNAPGIFFYYQTNPPSFSRGATVFQVGSGTYQFSLSNYSE